MEDIENKILKLIDKISHMENIEKFIEAKPIKTDTIVTEDWVRFKCQYTCGHYNNNLNCPPYTPTADEMSVILDKYDDAILIQCKNSLKTPSKIAVELEKIAIGMELYKATGLGAGPCTECKKCNLKTCINRDKVRPSMESCGINVQQTVKNNDYKMVENKNGEEFFYCYSLLLVK